MKDANIITQIKEEKDFFQKARLIQQLRTEKEVSLKHIAYLLDIKPSHVSHILRLLKLPLIVIDGYYANMVSVSHLFILARLKTETDILDVYELIMSKSLTSQQTEEHVRKKLHNISTSKHHISKDELDIFYKEIANQFPGLQCKVFQSRIKGKITLDLKGDTRLTTKILTDLMDRLSKTATVVKRRKETVFTLE